MRVMVDTNVLISAALKQSSVPATAVRLVAERHRLLKSVATERELFDTIDRPRLAPLIPPEFRSWLAGLFVSAEPVSIVERIAACRDPKDDKILEVAVNGRAEIVVSGDADLLVLDPYRSIPIVTAAAFLALR